MPNTNSLKSHVDGERGQEIIYEIIGIKDTKSSLYMGIE